MESEREYETTPQTAEALKGIVKAFADKRGLNSERYVYKILSGEALDEYHRFKHKLFRPALQCSPDSARVFVEDLQSEIERVEQSEPAERVDHGELTASLLSVLIADTTNAPESERVQAMKRARRALDLYLRSVEQGGELIQMERAATK